MKKYIAIFFIVFVIASYFILGFNSDSRIPDKIIAQEATLNTAVQDYFSKGGKTPDNLDPYKFIEILKHSKNGSILLPSDIEGYIIPEDYGYPGRHTNIVIKKEIYKLEYDEFKREFHIVKK